MPERRQVPHVRTALNLTPEDFAAYGESARQRSRQVAESAKVRRTRALELATTAASILKGRFGARRVAIFGSVLYPDRFTRWSDVDLIAWGIDRSDSLRAIGEIADLGAAHGIPVNLVDVATCRKEVLVEIMKGCVEV